MVAPTEEVTEAPAGPVTIDVWFHSGTGGEHDALTATVQKFNEENKDVQINLVLLPGGSYNDQVQAAAFSRKMPCVLDFDGPYVYNYVWAGLLLPLDDFVSADMKADILPSIIAQGTFQDNKLYSLGQFDSGLALWANKDHLTQAGVRIPTIDKPWTKDEFEEVLAKLKTVPGVTFPLDMKINYGKGEYFTYGYSPVLQSFGGDLIDRSDYQSADGVLNGPESVEALTTIKSWFDKGYVNPAQTSDTDFADGKSSLSFVGHWVFPDYQKALGDNLILVPMPDFGKGAKTGMGSWNWGITKDCQNPDAAWQVLKYFMSAEEVKRMTAANGAVPALKSVLEADTRYAEGGILNVYYQQLDKGWGVPRPITPAYPTITTAFAAAFDNIRNGADIKEELDKAVKAIDDNIVQNGGYPLSQ
ncbi:MAG: sugar ABC transporter substrate-binding protein [Chloroflexi bacterium]|nr:sugar ABC transporter substrate-binding protein [Chloroflexota bacterium]